MAVPKKKHTRSRSNKRRNADRKKKKELLLKKAVTALNKAKKAKTAK